MKFGFLDLVGVKGHEGKRSHEGCIIQGNRSSFGETYQVQWHDKDTIMHGDNLVSIVPKRR